MIISLSNSFALFFALNYSRYESYHFLRLDDARLNMGIDTSTMKDTSLNSDIRTTDQRQFGNSMNQKDTEVEIKNIESL